MRVRITFDIDHHERRAIANESRNSIPPATYAEVHQWLDKVVRASIEDLVADLDNDEEPDA